VRGAGGDGCRAAAPGSCANRTGRNRRPPASRARPLAPVDIAYGYRALREITDAGLSDNPRLWRDWFAAHGAETTDKFRRFEDIRDRRP
jgi:hypothetical protein